MAVILNDRVHRYDRSRGSLIAAQEPANLLGRVTTRIDAKRRLMLTST